MKKTILLLALFFVSYLKAQVGINTSDPKSTLEVIGQPTITTATDGIILPKLLRSQLIAKTGYGSDQTGAVVYVTDTSGTINAATAKVTNIGFYFWDGDSWEPIGNSGDGRNIYTENGALNGNRTVAQTTNTLAFTSSATTGTSHFTVDGSTFNVNAVSNNVGIGTSTPSGRLHVASDDGRDAVFSMGSNDANTNMDIDIYRYRGNASTPNVIQNGDNIGGLRFSGLNGTASGVVAPFTIMGEVNAVADGIITPTSAPGALNFRTTDNGTLTSSTKMTIKNNGNIGVLNTNPAATLDVVAKNSTGTNANVDGILIPRVSRQRAQSMTGIPISTLIYVNEIATGSATGNAIDITQVGFFFYNGSKWVSIFKPDGNVLNGLNFANNQIKLGGALTEPTTISSLTSTNKISFTGTGVDAFNIDGTTLSVDATNNRVGIGTSAPVLNLDVTTTSGIGVKASNTSQWDHLYFNSGPSSSTISAGGAENGLQFRVGNGATGSYGDQTYSTVATMMPSGNVGIGNTDPHAPLHFANSITNRKIVLFEGTNNDHQFYGLGINSNILRYQINSTSDNHIFYAGVNTTTSNELMRIQGNGNVGIGVNDPQQRLDVNGNVRIRGNNTIMYQNLADYRLAIREDYETSVTGWTNNTRTTYLGQSILGGYNVLSTGTNQKTFDLTGISHTSVKIKFSYYAIDSWDGETAYVRISGTGGGWSRVISFSEVTRENIVGGSWADGIYYGEIEVPHTGNSLTIVVGSTLNQTPDDESYGIDNIEIWVR